MLTKEDIKELVRGGEGFNVDFKRSVYYVQGQFQYTKGDSL